MGDFLDSLATLVTYSLVTAGLVACVVLSLWVATRLGMP